MQSRSAHPLALRLLLLVVFSTLAGCLEPQAQHPPLPPINNDDEAAVEESPEEDRSASRTGLKFITAGGYHTCASKYANNAIYCWGEGSRGQMGNNDIANQGLPARANSDTDWLLVSAGLRHNCGIRALEQTETITNEDGVEEKVVVGTLDTLWCWGDNSLGQTGQVDGNNDDIPDKDIIGGPSEVDIPLSGWTDVASGGYHSCAIREDADTDARTLYCWGSNKFGQTGDSSSRQIIFTPRQVDANVDWILVSAGENHTCGIRAEDGANTLWCWGSNTFKQLGVASVSGFEAAPQLIEIGGNAPAWLKVEAGDRHTCGIQADNSLWCWGDNAYGQLGQGDQLSRDTPTRVGNDNDWIDVSTGGPHSCALKNDGSLWCWGNNLYGQLGLAEVGHQLLPGKVLSEATFIAVTTGEYHTCALDERSESYCWGLNAEGQLGIAEMPDYVSSAQYNEENWKMVAAGQDYSCGIKADDTLWCGGINNLGQLGDKTPINRAAAVPVATDTLNWKTVSVGIDHACAISAVDGSLACWGSNHDEQLGTDADRSNNPSHWAPVEVASGGQWLDVSAGSHHTCGLRQEAAGTTAWCWGDNRYGQTTSASPDADFNATQIGTDTDWVAIAAGANHTCGIRETEIQPLTRELYCWGRNNAGQLGQDLATATSAVPLRVGSDTDWVDISAGDNHTCGIRQTSTAPLQRIVICWGEDNSGQTPEIDVLGGETLASLRQVGNFEDWLSVKAGPNITCGLRALTDTDASLYCWGDNSAKQIRNSGAYVTTPTGKGTRQWLSYSLGAYHTCGVAQEDNGQSLFCWGRSAPFQLGDGNAWQFTPQALIF